MCFIGTNDKQKGIFISSTKLAFFLIFYFFPFYLYILVFRDMVFLCDRPCCPETHFIDQTVLDLNEIPLPLPPESWD